MNYKTYTVRVYENGTKEWYLNDQLHREDGPAIEFDNGTKAWYLNGKRHREDGPAFEWADGTKEWWVDGRQLTEQEFLQKTKTDEDRTVVIDGVKYKLVKM